MEKIIVDYVRAKLKSDVEALLDDPHGVFGDMSASDIVSRMQTLDRLCELVDLELDVLLTGGTDFEFKRLMDIMVDARINT